MTKTRTPLLIFTSLAILLPVNIYFSENFFLCGVQWGLVRYQNMFSSHQVLSFTTDLCSVVSGTISGSSANAVILWGGAVMILLAALILNIVALCRRVTTYAKAAAGLTIVAGIGFLLADFVQYGIFLNGTAGWCIPVGIPTILVLGLWGCLTNFEPETPQETMTPTVSCKKVPDADTNCTRLWILLHDHDILSLILLSVIIKAVAFFFGLLPNISFAAITGDLTLYHWYAVSIFFGRIPYISYFVAYPQLFLIPVFLALLPVLGMQNPVGYLYSFSALMIIIDTSTLVLIYLLAAKFFGKEKAFLSGLLYATAIAAAYFVPITFDAFPTFLMVFSLWLFFSRKNIASFVTATVATLMKWYPIFCFPYYLVYAHKNGQLKSLKKSLALSISIGIAVIAPFIIMNLAGFLKTYLYHFSRLPEINSLIYYLDAISEYIFHVNPFGTWSLAIPLIGELLLFWGYIRRLDKEPLTLVYVIFLSVFIFVLTNKVFSACYLIWLTPFLSLILAQSTKRIILFFLAQGIIYLETPVLFGIIYTPSMVGANSRLFYSVLDNSLPSISLIFYTIKFAIFFAILWICISDIRKNHLSLPVNDKKDPPSMPSPG